MKYKVKKLNLYHETFIYYDGTNYKKAIEVYLDLTEVHPKSTIQLVDSTGKIHCERKIGFDEALKSI